MDIPVYADPGMPVLRVRISDEQRRSVDCQYVLEEWHRDRSSFSWRQCCDQVELKPAERKALLERLRNRAATAKGQ